MAIKLKSSVDNTELNKIFANLNRLSEREVSVGYDGSPHEGSKNLSKAELVNIIEGGARNAGGGMKLPPRPFMEMAASIWENDIEALSAKVVKGSLENNNNVVNKALDEIGVLGVQAIQSAIDSQAFAKLKPSTINIKRDKGSRFPEMILVDTGDIYESQVVSIK